MGFSATLAHLIIRSHYNAQLAALEIQEPSGTDKAQMRTTENRARYAPGRTEIVEHTITETVAQDPAAVLKQLEAIEPGKQNRNPKLRKVVHYLETLTELGTESLAAIDDYLATGQDVSYGYTYSRNFNVRGATNQNLQYLTGRIQGAQNGQQPAVRTYNYFSNSYGSPSAGYLVPPSLRMGLFQVVSEINGSVAEKLLADSLGMTQKGAEAASLDSLLHKMAPDQYKSLALSVAKDLLLNPTEESLKDYRHKTHLYSILTRHRDLDFAQDAQELLIDAAGKLDRFALNYLTTVLKADAVPMLAKAQDDPNIKSQWDRQSLLGYIMRYVGMHPQADEFFKRIMSQPVEQAGNSAYYQSPQQPQLQRQPGNRYQAQGAARVRAAQCHRRKTQVHARLHQPAARLPN